MKCAQLFPVVAAAAVLFVVATANAQTFNQGASAGANPQPEQVAIPKFLEKLNLSQQQLDQVRENVRDYDADSAARACSCPTAGPTGS